MNADDTKIVVALNKNLECGPALNTSAHLGLGLAAKLSALEPAHFQLLQFTDFRDAGGEAHDFISARSLIVLRARNAELRAFRQELGKQGVLFVDFTNQMTGETWVEQVARSAVTPERELEYFGVAAFGTRSILDPLTKKLSLWR